MFLKPTCVNGILVSKEEYSLFNFDSVYNYIYSSDTI